MNYLDTEYGTILDNPIAPPTHKTRDIAREEWALNFTPTETALMDKLKVLFATVVEPDLSFISFAGKSPDANGFKTKTINEPADFIGEEYAGQKVLDVVRSSFSRYAEMSGLLNVSDPRLIGSVQLFHLLGWLDNKDRKDALLLGVPYAKLAK